MASAAVVVSIDDPLTLPPAPEGAALVTGTFATTRAVIVDVWIEGLDKPIGATPGHPIWSLDRDGWASAGALEPGERLQTADGVATVACVTSHPGTETVYNLELEKDHRYFVSDARLCVHNSDPCIFPKWARKHEQREWITQVASEMVENKQLRRVTLDYIKGTLRDAQLSKKVYQELVEHAEWYINKVLDWAP